MGNNGYGQCNVLDWENIVAISAGEVHTVGLRSDGTVVTTESGSLPWKTVSDWTQIRLPEPVKP